MEQHWTSQWISKGVVSVVWHGSTGQAEGLTASVYCCVIKEDIYMLGRGYEEHEQDARTKLTRFEAREAMAWLARYIE